METNTSVGRYAGIGVALVRLVLGVLFFAHGYHKVIGFEDAGLGGAGGLANVVAFMTGMGMPVPVVYMVAFGEFLGGLALIFGFLSRFAAFGIMIIMIGAIFMVHLPGGLFINWALSAEASHGFEYNLALVSMCWLILLAGPGRFALDNLIFKR